MDVAKHTGHAITVADVNMARDGPDTSLNDCSTRCIAMAGCHGINLNGFGEEYPSDQSVKARGRTHMPGFGIPTGITNRLSNYAYGQMKSVH